MGLWIWGSAVNGSLGNTFSSSAISIPTPITTFMGGTNWKYVSVNSDGPMAVFSGTTPDLPIS